MLDTWIVVADSSMARFYLATDKHQPLVEFDNLLHMEGRLREHDELSDRQGSIAGGHHNFSDPTDLKHHEAEVFARQICAQLETGRVNHHFQQLILVAPPAFLGTLRQTLNPHLSKMVSNSLSKNLLNADPSELSKQLFQPVGLEA